MTINEKKLQPIVTKTLKNVRKVDNGKMKKEDLTIFLLPILNKSFDESRKAINKTIREEQNDSKLEILDNYIKYAENHNMIFFLASCHGDCAPDHLNYQGKLYLDQHWYQKIQNDKEAVKYVKSLNLHTLNWVTGKPVYFITRPYCRHYFRALDYQEVHDNSVETLIEKYHMYKKIGDRGFRPIAHPKTKEWYDNLENIKTIIEQYKDRLSYHEMLYAKNHSDRLAALIEKDKLLIKKWENYLKNRSK